jgi:hypothetical protein
MGLLPDGPIVQARPVFGFLIREVHPLRASVKAPEQRR